MRWWLAGVVAAAGVITALAVFAIVTRQEVRVLADRSRDIVAARTARIARQLEQTRDPARFLRTENQRFPGYQVWAVDDSGELISDRVVDGIALGDVRNGAQALRRALQGRVFEQEQIRGARDLDNEVLVTAIPIRDDAGLQGAVLARLESPTEFAGVLDELREDALIALGLATLLGIVVGVATATLISRRVGRLAESAELIAAGRLDQPLEQGWADEIGDLARALERMRESLLAGFDVLSSERDKLSAIFAGLRDGVLVVGYDGSLRFSNPAAERLLDDGAPAAELRPLLREAAERGKAEASELRHQDRVYAVHIRDLPAEQAVLAAARDRTEELQRELAEREFVSNAAHELRNPLAGISSTLEVLMAGAKDDPRARDRFLHRLAGDAERLSRIIGALLTLARVEAATEEQAQTIDVSACAEEAVAAAPPPPELRLELDVPVGSSCHADPVLLRQVLVGLLSNAYKHTDPPGRVAIRARRRGADAMLIEVEDTGEGIRPEDQGRVFERFYRSEGAREKDGFGLGLAIAKRMVRVMGGEIGVRSTPGRGSTFWMRLPVHASPRARRTPTAVS